MKKKIFLFIIFIILMIYVYPYINHNYDDKFIQINTNKNAKEQKSLAIMINNDDGKGYIEYKDGFWPNARYKFKESRCTNNDGNIYKNILKVDQEEKAFYLKTTKTVRCTIYFELKSNLEIMQDNDPNKTLSSELVGGMYRYQGVGAANYVDEKHKLVDHNYICFGTNVEQECTQDLDKYMFRIIGITEDGKLKLIKMQRTVEGGVNAFTWSDKWRVGSNTDEDCDNDQCPEWPDSLIFKRLNGLSNGNISGYGRVTDGANTDIFINNPNYPYMKEGNEWYKKIVNYDWLYGDIDNSISSTIIDNETVYGARNNGLIVYQIESGQVPTQHYEFVDGNWKYVKYNWTKTINAKIGLIYLHDYYLAYDNERNWHDSFDQSNWIHSTNNKYYYWPDSDLLMVRLGPRFVENLNFYQWLLLTDGSVRGGYGFPSANVARPVFYVDNVKISAGDGTLTHPYLL